MQTRMELYDYLGYHAFEQKLDALFAPGTREHAMTDTEETMTETHLPKPKKSVALSGTAAGNTAICTVGRTGNDLHYRGYDILDFADQAEFEEIAHLLIHGQPAQPGRTGGLQASAQILRGLPAALKTALEQIPASAHPMDVLRTGTSLLGTLEPEKEDMPVAAPRRSATGSSPASARSCSTGTTIAHHGRRIDVETDDDTIGGHFLHLLHGEKPSTEWVRAMHTSLILYAEHEFNASTFTARVIAGTNSDIYSAITGAIGALRGPSTAAPTRPPARSSSATPRRRGRGRHPRAGGAQGDHHRLRSSGLHDRRSAQQGHQGRRRAAVELNQRRPDAHVFGGRPAGDRHVGSEEDVPQPRLVLGRVLCT
jgi:hypothetical protein